MPARRLVDDPHQREVVPRVAQHPQVGHEVLDLGAVVEAHAAHQRVGDLARQQLVLDRPGLRVGAHQDGHVRQLEVAPQALQRAHDPGGLVPLVARLVELDLGAGPLSVQRRLPRRLTLLAISAPETSRIVWVER